MRVSYQRVSTVDQSTARQESNLKSYVDKCSGSIAFSERPAAIKLLKDIESGGITAIEVHSIDRLGRNTIDIMQTIQLLTNKGINVISNKEGLQTIVNGKENPVSKLMIGILGTLAEFELTRIKERQMEGIEKAKAKGVYAGRNVGSKESTDVFMSKPKNQKILKTLKQGNSIRRTALLCECSINLLTKVKRANQ